MKLANICAKAGIQDEPAQPVEQKSANVSDNPDDVEGTKMRKGVFSVIVAGERDSSQIESVRQQSVQYFRVNNQYF